MATDPLKMAIKGTTQDHLPIEDIVDGIVILKDGSCALIMQISSVNFDLLSEKEQSALVFAYGGILNSLNFPVQIIIHSTAKDITSYMNYLQSFEEKPGNNPLLKERIKNYRKFIEEMVQKNDVLSKSFYIAVSFSILELGLKSATGQNTFASGLPFLPKPAPTSLPFTKEYILDKAKASLEPRRDHIMRLFARLGLEVKPLSTKELIQLMYRIYNEESAPQQKIQSLEFNTPITTTKLTPPTK
ncbi:hypothetical protein M1116_03730 [Patescibacteria group bacterium]|nr:hypothetical protein [Patescibacteria group bacterium]